MSAAELSPETQRIVDLASSAFPRLGTEVTDPVEARRMLAPSGAAKAAPVVVARVENRVVPGDATTPDVAVRCYWPRVTDESLPMVMFMHGGGFVLCDLDTHDSTCRSLCVATDAIVVAVDYRLAPESPYPAALADGDLVFDWIKEQASEFGGDAGTVAVAGDSAGGNLVAALCLRRRDNGRSMPSHQLLFYPVLDARQATESHERYADGYFLTAAHLEWYWGLYLGEADALDPYVSPVLAAELVGLPPALIVVAGCDPLHDEGVAYANALTAADVAVSLMDEPGLFHGFLGFTAAVPAAKVAVDEAFARARAVLRA